MLNYKKIFKNKIKNSRLKIGIIGLGYVGLPLAKTFTSNKINVLGFDIDKKKIFNLNRNISYINYFKNSDIKKMRTNFDAFSSFEKIQYCDVIILCLPTPLKSGKKPEMKYIVNSMKLIKKFLRKGQILSLESTTYPGTTEEVILPFLKEFNVGKDFFLVFSPEREDPGNKKFPNYKIPKVVGGYTKNCLEIGSLIYKLMGTKIIRVSSLKIAEFTKLLENIYRSVNIGLVNELKNVCQKMNINIFEVINAAKTKPFGFQAFYPGPGYGGHCIPIDPFLLTWKAKQYGAKTDFIKLSGKINERMPVIISNKIISYSKAFKKNQKKCLIIGVAYKKNVDDMRESPALKIIQVLKKNNVKCEYFDPYIKEIRGLRNFNFSMKSIQMKYKNLKKYFAIVLVTDHDCFNYDLLLKHSSRIFDCRGRYSHIVSEKITQI